MKEEALRGCFWCISLTYCLYDFEGSSLIFMSLFPQPKNKSNVDPGKYINGLCESNETVYLKGFQSGEVLHTGSSPSPYSHTNCCGSSLQHKERMPQETTLLGGGGVEVLVFWYAFWHCG